MASIGWHCGQIFQAGLHNVRLQERSPRRQTHDARLHTQIEARTALQAVLLEMVLLLARALKA